METLIIWTNDQFLQTSFHGILLVCVYCRFWAGPRQQHDSGERLAAATGRKSNVFVAGRKLLQVVMPPLQPRTLLSAVLEHEGPIRKDLFDA